MAGTIKVDTLQSDSNLALKIATANVAFIDSNGLNVVGGNLTLGGTQFAEGGQIQTSGIADGAITNDKIVSVANTKITGTLGGNYIMSTFTSPGTWDADTKKAAGLKSVKVTVIGGGGGGVANSASPPASPPAGVITTGGTGNTSSFGAFASSTGGAGGTVAYTPAPAGSLRRADGGLGGVGSNGDINSQGTIGSFDRISYAVFDPVVVSFSGSGGSTPMGAGGTITQNRPAALSGYGGGGGGFDGGGGGGGTSIRYITSSSIPGPVSITVGTGGSTGNTPAPLLPSAQIGANGVVIIEEFY